MGIVKTARLVYEYIRRDEEEKIEEVKRAIDGVDLDIKKGSFVAVLGHNGSGKSTFAKHINGLLLPTVGYKRRGTHLGCAQNSGNGIPESG